jgi:hypothetical protein
MGVFFAMFNLVMLVGYLLGVPGEAITAMTVFVNAFFLVLLPFTLGQKKGN